MIICIFFVSKYLYKSLEIENVIKAHFYPFQYFLEKKSRVLVNPLHCDQSMGKMKGTLIFTCSPLQSSVKTRTFKYSIFSVFGLSVQHCFTSTMHFIETLLLLSSVDDRCERYTRGQALYRFRYFSAMLVSF